MPRLILLNKPFDTICQFSASPPHATLADWVPVAGVYPAGRLDTDSEGMVLLTDHGPLQHAIAHRHLNGRKIAIGIIDGDGQASGKWQGRILIGALGCGHGEHGRIVECRDVDRYRF